MNKLMDEWKDENYIPRHTLYAGGIITGLLVAHFENIGFYIGSSYSKYRLFTGFSKKNIG